MRQVILYIGSVAGMVLPFFNIPLILKIRRQKSSKEFSLVWVLGVFSCILLTLPQIILSPDVSYKIFGITNFLFFSVVVYYVYRYR